MEDLLPLATAIASLYDRPVDTVLHDLLRTSLRVERRECMYAANPGLDPEDPRNAPLDPAVLDDLLTPIVVPSINGKSHEMDLSELLAVAPVG